MTVENKLNGGRIEEVKIGARNGVQVGFVSGYIATWDLDEGMDRFVAGCFEKSLSEHRERGDRQIRLKDHHFKTIGGFPIDTVREDKRGLYGEGEVNLEIQEGREAFALAKQGVLTDLSIGFTPVSFSFEEEGRIRVIDEALVWEGSIVDEPMNRGANITSVKHRFRDLPVADAETEWTEYTGKDRRAFLDGDQTAIACEVDGGLMVVPRRLDQVASELMAGGSPDRSQIAILEGYFAKMGRPSPFPAELRGFYGVDDIRGLTVRGLQDALRNGSLSKAAAAWIADGMKPLLASEPMSPHDIEKIAELAASLKDSRARLDSVTV